jgi:hypothetical protein
MRYLKGTFVITRERDIPLLRHVRNSRFVAHPQLLELLQYDAAAPCRNTYNWRVQRLLRTGHIRRVEAESWRGTPVYTITPKGLIELESHGDFAVGLNSRTRRMPDSHQVFHSLELNAIRLCLARNGLLVNWQSEVELSSINMVSSAPYQKDYDAIVKIWIGREVREFALEYERSLKNTRQYESIREALAAERQIECILYLAADHSILVALLHQLTPSPKRMGFLTAQAFREQLLDASVTVNPDRPMVPLEEFLQYAHPLYMRA